MSYLGDYAEDDALYFKWSTNDSDGASVTRSGDGVIRVYKDNDATGTQAGVTNTEDWESHTGIHYCAIDLSADAYYAVGSDYTVLLQGATIDGQTVNAVLAHFSIENRYARGTDSAALATVCTETRLQALTDWLNGGRLDVLLDAIPTTAMRGTDSASTHDAADVLAAIQAAGTHLTLIKAVTDLLPDSGALTTIGTDTARLTAVRAAVLTDWINGGRLDLLLDQVITDIAALNDLSAANVNAEVVDALDTDTYAEPGQGAPAATASITDKLGYLYKFLRNKIVQDATTLEVYNDAGAVVDQKATVSDDGTDFTRGEIGSGP